MREQPEQIEQMIPAKDRALAVRQITKDILLNILKHIPLHQWASLSRVNYAFYYAIHRLNQQTPHALYSLDIAYSNYDDLSLQQNEGSVFSYQIKLLAEGVVNNVWQLGHSVTQSLAPFAISCDENTLSVIGYHFDSRSTFNADQAAAKTVGSVVATFNQHQSEVNCVISLDHNTVISTDQTHIRIWQLPKKKSIEVSESESYQTTAAVTAIQRFDATQFITGHANGEICWWHRDQPQPMKTWSVMGHHNIIDQLACGMSQATIRPDELFAISDRPDRQMSIDTICVINSQRIHVVCHRRCDDTTEGLIQSSPYQRQYYVVGLIHNQLDLRYLQATSFCYPFKPQPLLLEHALKKSIRLLVNDKFLTIENDDNTSQMIAYQLNEPDQNGLASKYVQHQSEGAFLFFARNAHVGCFAPATQRDSAKIVLMHEPSAMLITK